MNRNAVTAIRELHARIPHPYLEDQYRCEHCASLCHDRSGVGCEVGGDAPWPCDTIRLLDEALTIPAIAPGYCDCGHRAAQHGQYGFGCTHCSCSLLLEDLTSRLGAHIPEPEEIEPARKAIEA